MSDLIPDNKWAGGSLHQKVNWGLAALEKARQVKSSEIGDMGPVSFEHL